MEFEFDSADANIAHTGTATSLNWPQFELARPLTNVASVKIIEVTVPFSYYVFNSKNNTFTLTESDGGATVTVTIPPGNYTTTQMVALLSGVSTPPYAGILTLASPNAHTYTTTYDSIANKFTITSNAGTTKTFTLTFTSYLSKSTTNPSDWLGFNEGANTSTTSQVLVAPNGQSVTGPNYLFLNSTMLGSQIALFLPIGSPTANGGIGPQICKIPINVNPGGVIEWQDPDPQKWFDLENMQNLAFVDLYFTMGNSDQKPLDFNGQAFSVKMGVLINQMNHVDNQSGLHSQGRVSKRIRPY